MRDKATSKIKANFHQFVLYIAIGKGYKFKEGQFLIVLHLVR